MCFVIDILIWRNMSWVRIAYGQGQNVTHAMELWVSYKRQVSLSRKSVEHGLTGNMMCLCNTVLHYRCHVVKVVVMTQCYIN